MKLIYGTKNPSKLESMEKMLDGLGIIIDGIDVLGIELVEVDETGNNPLDNARQKAISYYHQIRQPVFSCDSGLYFEDVDVADQPGVHIKRIHGNNLEYHEFSDYYSNLARKYGGKLVGYYQNSICLVFSEDEIYECDSEDIQSEKFYIVDKPHINYREGFPLDSLSVHIKTGKYYYDLPDDVTKNVYVRDGFRRFFRSVIAKRVNNNIGR